MAALTGMVLTAGGCTSTFERLQQPSDPPEDWGPLAVVAVPFVVVYIAAREVFEFFSRPAPWDRD